MKTKLLLMIGLIYGLCMNAQVRWSKDLFPSPTAASLMQYIDMPVSHYTGVPSINIPLYTIKVSGYELPISLSYHASGIKVSQEASWVGLGWSLNAGGAITRVVRCKDDFDSSNGYLYDGLIVPKNPGESSYADYVGTTQPSLNDNSTNEVMKSDGEPDLFYYNFAGFQGQFIFNKKRVNNKVISEAFSLNPQDNLQIKLISGPHGQFAGFRITDTNGIEYTFSTVELKKSYSDGDVTTELSCPITIGADDPNPEHYDWEEEYISAWYLDSIKLPNQDVITFSYKYEDMHYNGPTFYSYVSRTPLYRTVALVPLPQQSTTYSNKEAEVSSPILSAISWPMGEITFETNDRIDMRSWGFTNTKSPQKLDYILVTPLFGDTPLLINLQTSYFGKDCDSKKNHLYKRLRLDGVSIIESEVGDSQNYSFGYDERYNLPAKNGATDFWGYYATKNRGSNIYLCTGNYDDNPSGISVFTAAEDFYLYSETGSERILLLKKGRLFLGENRSCDPERVSTYTLNRITYPTGGSRGLYYEPNQTKEPTIANSYLGGGIRIKKIVSSDKIETFTYEEDGVSTGLMINKPLIYSYYSIITRDFSDIYLLLSSAGYASSESTVGYSKVRINTSGVKYEDYYFRNAPLPKGRNPWFPNQKNADNGLLERKVYYDGQTNIKIKEELYRYAEGCSSNKVTALRLYNAIDSEYPIYSLNNTFYNMTYKRTFENNYDHPDKMVVLTENFSYYPNTSYVKQKTYNNRKTDLSYSFNLDTPIYKGMTERNIIVPVEEVLSADNRVVGGSLTEYNLLGGLYLPAKISAMKLPRDSVFSIIPNTRPQQLPTQIKMYDGVTKSARYQDDLTFHSYDRYGNPTLVEDKSGLYTIVKWDYAHQYPVLQIVNPYQELIDNIRRDNTYIDGLTSYNLKSGDLYDDMEVKKYDYTMLRGVNSITNPRGQVTLYDFDMLGRLLNIYHQFSPSQRAKVCSYRYHYQSNF